MFVVYIIRNTVTGKHYIGSTNNLERRIIEHNRGQTRSTRRKGEWEIIYKEKFLTNIEAIRRERQIKSYKGETVLKR